MIKRFLKAKTLYIEISQNYINLCFINKNSKIQNYISIPLMVNTIKNDELINSKYIEDIIKEYTLKNGKRFSKVILVIDVSAVIRFVSYPSIKDEGLPQAIKYSLKDHLLIDLKLHTIDYRVIDYQKDQVNVILVAVKTNTIQSYIKIFNNLKINITTIDIYQNFINLYLGSKDKGSIIAVILQNDKIIIQFITNGKLNYIKESDYTNLEFLFNPHIEINGKINIERAYVPKGVKQSFIEFLKNFNVEIIYISSLFYFWQDQQLNTQEFWNINRGL